MNITTLPTDILILVLENLSLAGLSCFSCTCRSMNALVEQFGWAGYLHCNPRPSYSLSRTAASWSFQNRVRYNTLTDHAWSTSNFIARPLSRPWIGKLQPLMAINQARLIVASGNSIYSYRFGNADEGQSPSVQIEGIYPLFHCDARSHDITGLAFTNDGEQDQTVIVGYLNGSTERVVLPNSGKGDDPVVLSREIIASLSNGDFVENLSAEANHFLSLSANGLATLTNQSSHATSTIDLKSRSWTSHLSMHSSGPYAAFGTSSTTPLAIHDITGSQLSTDPSAILHTEAVGSNAAPDHLPSSAVYGLSQAPLAAPWGSSPQIIVSGWFDGLVRCYDLRSSSRMRSHDRTSLSPLKPVLSLDNPWSFESIYSVSCGGGYASHIAAGTARHSVVSFWDVRAPSAGWSVHAPGNDPSPVYSVILESSRLFGATQSRPFVYDFGPGIGANTFPSLPQNGDGLRRRDGLTYHVTKYTHSHPSGGAGNINEH